MGDGSKQFKRIVVSLLRIMCSAVSLHKANLSIKYFQFSVSAQGCLIPDLNGAPQNLDIRTNFLKASPVITSQHRTCSKVQSRSEVPHYCATLSTCRPADQTTKGRGNLNLCCYHLFACWHFVQLHAGEQQWCPLYLVVL